MKELINEFEEEYNYVHSFSNGIYVRSGTVPKGTVIIGHIHKQSHLNILSSGSMRLWMNGVFKTVKAPAIFEAQENSRKVFFTLEDCVFSNIHKTDKQTEKELREELIREEPLGLEIKNIVNKLTQKELTCS